MVIGDPIGFDLLGGQISGDVDWDLGEAQLLRCLEPGVTNDDHTLRIDDDRLTKAKLLDTCGHRRDRLIVVAGVLVVGLDVTNRPLFDLHGAHRESTGGMCWWLREAECGPGNPGRRNGTPESAELWMKYSDTNDIGQTIAASLTSPKEVRAYRL